VIQVASYPGIVSVFIIDRCYMNAVAQASLMPNGIWYFNRLLIKNPKERGKGTGSKLLARLKEELIKQNCRILVVEPGGYGADPVRQWRFYSERGFKEKRANGGKYLEWRP
jgi:GNAT superfamily N-acetyltransferase